MTEVKVEPTDEQIIEHEHKRCAYYTIDRTRAVEWPHTINGNEQAFIEQLGKSEVAFIRNSHWADLIGSNAFINCLDPNTRYDEVLDGSVGTACGCKLVTDAFCEPVAKDPAPHTIWLIPRQV